MCRGKYEGVQEEKMDQKQEINSFEEALRLYLKKLDIKYEQLRLIAASVTFLNKSHPEYRSAFEKFEGTLDDIFQLKGVWYEARKLGKKE